MSLKGTDANVIKKRKQKLVKHKRKNWKKTDISEIEKSIDDLRHEERTGGIRAEKKDEELFFVDKTKQEVDLDKLSARETRALRRNKLSADDLNKAKCYRNLQPEPYSAPVHNTYSFTPKSADSKRTKKHEENEKNIAKKVVVAKGKAGHDVTAKKEIKDTMKLRSFDNDLWSAATKFEPEKTEVNEYFLRTTRKIMPKKPKNFDAKTSALPAIEIPHPGTSYNPTYDDHQALLLKAHELELVKLKKEQKLMRSTDAKMTKMSAQDIEKLWLLEMSGGLGPENEEKDADDEEEESKKIVRGSDDDTDDEDEKKEQIVLTMKTKKRLLDEKMKKKLKENEKQKRIQESEIYRLKSIKKEIGKKEREHKAEMEKREAERKQKELYGPKRIGRLKYEEPELELKLSDEITGSLRSLKPEGNILRDRYKSLQKRNIVETRERAKKQKHYWTKKFEKKDPEAVI